MLGFPTVTLEFLKLTKMRVLTFAGLKSPVFGIPRYVFFAARNITGRINAPFEPSQNTPATPLPHTTRKRTTPPSVRNILTLLTRS